MFTKELTERRNKALERRKELLSSDTLPKNTIIKLEYPAILKSKIKGQQEPWKTIERF